MAQILLNIPDAQVQRVIDALCALLKTPTGASVDPTPALAKGVLIDMIKERVKFYEEEKARATLVAIDVTNLVN